MATSMRVAAALLAVLCVFACAQAAPLKFEKTTLALSLRVDKNDWHSSLTEFETLIDFAKKEKINANIVLYLRAAADKIRTNIAKVEKSMAEEEAKKAKDAPVEAAVFTNSSIGVKPLKDGMASKINNVPRYEAADVPSLLSAGNIDVTKPFLITNGVTNWEELKKTSVAQQLLDQPDVQLRYLSPVVAKKKRSFDQPQAQDEEQLEYSIINFEKYFRNCFNLNAKPDFRKMAGGDTEHCEQLIPTANLRTNTSGFVFESLDKHMGWLQKLDAAKQEFLSKAKDLQPLLGANGGDIKKTLGASDSRQFQLGPAGSGEQLKQEGTHYADGLIHGRRRWFFMQPEAFVKLRDTAKEVLEPASSFMFFEQQLGELVEDYNLGGKGMEYFECNQNAGDVLFIPGTLIKTGLSLQDSFSIRTSMATSKDEVLTKINGALWAPESGVVPNGYSAAACYNWDFNPVAAIDGRQLNPMQGQIIGQILQQHYGQPGSRNSIVLQVLAQCDAVGNSNLFNPARTICPNIWRDCVGALEKNSAELGSKAEVPKWLEKSRKFKVHPDALEDFSIPAYVGSKDGDKKAKGGKKGGKKKGKKSEL